MNRGKMIIDYEGISLHVTPYKWIALAYTGHRPTYKHKDVKYYFNFSVSVKDKDDNFKNKTVGIW